MFLEKIQQRFNRTVDSNYFQGKDFQTVREEQETTGVLLNLSMKHNRLSYEPSYHVNSTTIRNVCNNVKKREVLDKIRKKILDKRRMSAFNERSKIVGGEAMWRPWRL